MNMENVILSLVTIIAKQERLMTTAQKTKYLDAIYQHFGAQGYVLTVPELAA